MNTVVSQVELPCPATRAWAFLTAPGALRRMLPAWSGARIERADAVADRSHSVLRVPLPGFGSVRWVANHALQSPLSFTDVQISGPFAHWQHTHRVEPITAQRCRLIDQVAWSAPCGLDVFSAGMVTRDLRRLFAWRDQRLSADLAMPLPPALRIAVSGAQGLVGRELCARLGTMGHTVLPLQRRPDGTPGIAWDPARGRIDGAALATCDAVVHLAGETVAQRWTPAARTAIARSRIDSTALLARTMAALTHGPRVLITASGTSLSDGDAAIDERSALAPSNGFLAGVIRDWEAAADPARAAGLRVAHLRIGLVLDAQGGALASMLPAFRCGLGGRIGSGQQWLSWIAIDDLVELFVRAISDAAWHGAIYAVAPQPIRQGEFAAALGSALRRPAWIPAPLPLLRLAFGADMVRETVLANTRIIPHRAQSLGFSWRFPELPAALRWVLGAT